MTAPSERDVMVLARPLSLASLGTDVLSQGVFPFCHWGVLVSSLERNDLNGVLSREDGIIYNVTSDLGVLWELWRDGRTNNVHLTRPFRISHLDAFWRGHVAIFVGRTERTDDDIQQIGTE